jgi:hypothetical protein
MTDVVRTIIAYIGTPRSVRAKHLSESKMKKDLAVVALSGVAVASANSQSLPASCSALSYAAVVTQTNALIDKSITAARNANAAPAVAANDISSVEGTKARFKHYIDTRYLEVQFDPLPPEQVAPTLGYEVNWNVAHSRYASALHVWLNRAGSPTAALPSSAPVPGATVLSLALESQDAIRKLHMHIERMNRLAEDCMKQRPY